MSETPCKCRPSQFPFHCSRHNCTKSEKFHKLCQTERYYQLWEQCKGPGQSPDCLPQHSRGLGDTIAKITRATGIDRVVKNLAKYTSKTDCGCNKRRNKLNTALAYKRSSQHKQLSLPAAPQATTDLNPVVSTNVEITPTLKMPQPPVIKNWAVGITTAPRRNPTLKTCVESVQKAGWSPIVFAEPGSDLTGTESCQVICRPTRLGAWHNWLAMARQLLAENPDAEAFVTIQDDTIIAPGCKEFLERDLWPCPNVGFVSLYTPKHYSILHVVEDNNGNEVSRHLNEFRARRQAKKLKYSMVEHPRPTGCWRVSTSSLWGACALVFPRAALSQIVNHHIAGNWTGVKSSKNGPPRAAHNIANVDTAIGKIVMALRLEMRTYTPSLAQHIARYSSIGHGDNRGRRAAVDYVGNDANLWDTFESTADRVRFYDDGTPHKVGNKEYEDACLRWHNGGHSISMSISVECWNELKEHIERCNKNRCDKKSCRTLEFGSGVSTELFKSLETDHTAVEQDQQIALALGHPVRHHEIANDWYNWQPDGQLYDIILIDGPQGTGNRNAVLNHLTQLVHPQTVIFVDDTDRENERQLAHKIASKLGYAIQRRNRYSVLTPQ